MYDDCCVLRMPNAWIHKVANVIIIIINKIFNYIYGFMLKDLNTDYFKL